MENVNYYDNTCYNGKKCMVGKENFICISEYEACPINDVYISAVPEDGYIMRRLSDGRYLLYNSENE